MQQIIVDIDTDGAITIDAKGFTGTDCEEATPAGLPAVDCGLLELALLIISGASELKRYV